MSLLIIAFFIFGSSTVNHENLLSNQIIDKTDDNNTFPNNVYETDLSQLSVEIADETSETADINSGAYDYWLIIENETEDSDTRVSATYIEAAQKFEIVEENANITQIKLYIQYIDLFKDGEYPQGTVSIFNDIDGEPGTPLGTTTLEEGFASLDLGVSIGPTWITFTFLDPINVVQGFYWIVLSDTGNQAAGFWEWYTQDDQTNGDTGDWAAKSSHDSSWVLNPFPPGDLLSEIRILTMNSEPEPEPEPEPEYYTHVFESHGKGKVKYVVTLKIEKYTIKKSGIEYKSSEKPFHKACEKRGLNKRIDWLKFKEASNGFVFLIEIKNIEICSSKKCDGSDKVTLGVIASNIKSFISEVSQIDSFQCEAIVFRVTNNNANECHSHDVVMVFSYGRCNSSNKRKQNN